MDPAQVRNIEFDTGSAAREGKLPDFLAQTSAVRVISWLRRLLICVTGVVRSPPREDALSPTWANVVSGRANVRDAVRGTNSLETVEKRYRLNDEVAHA